MAVILKKIKGQKIQKGNPTNDWKHLATLIKIILILFVLFSIFHFVIKKKVAHLPIQNSFVTASAEQKDNSASAGKLYTVRKGDTLWSIVLKHYPKDNPANRISEIETLNNLSNDRIKPGQPLKLP
ncbi:LysM peptidoglycan-binding domain-containing protein [Ammoniphilus resinae]|uniref:LysM repeat protein n=1 Tax=Ammoniphilus resinae TaxID=861532 RepID=A0ABS4GKT9_9BACL|nr:LysM peptidoglycan-binding domain-containing protein [Ammoniphilus resinae]MBP1930520.1 LysM repeat protein [Ammoniphilus resinae]